MRWLALLLFGLSFAAGASSRAQAPISSAPPTDDALEVILADPRTTARDAYALGVALFEAERYEAAERAWARSNDLGPNTALLIAIADARERRGDEPGAVVMLKRYLAERPEAPDRAAVEARIAMLIEAPATLVVRSTEPGHAILLDGTPIDRKTPAEVEVEPGSHTVLVVGNGKQVGEQSVQVGYGERRELVFTASTPSEVAVEDSGPELDIAAEETTARRAVWALTSLSGAALVMGTALGATALVRQRQYRDDPAEQTADNGERLALFADVSFGISALSAITALTVFLTTRNKRKRRERATVQLQPRGGGAAATIRF